MKNQGLVQPFFRDTIPREVGAPTESGQSFSVWPSDSLSLLRRVRRPRGEPETALNGGMRSKLLPKNSIETRGPGVLPVGRDVKRAGERRAQNVSDRLP